MSTLTLQVPEDIAGDLAELARDEDKAPDALVCELIARAKRLRDFDRARAEIIRSLGDRAPKTDEEAFELFGDRHS